MVFEFPGAAEITMSDIFCPEDLAGDCAPDKAYESPFCGTPLPTTRAVGSPINPKAVK